MKVLSYLMDDNQRPKGFTGDVISKGSKYLSDIFNRDYWKRIWVIQEIAVAKKAFLHCGPFSAEIPSGGCLERMAQYFQGLDDMDFTRFRYLSEKQMRELRDRRKRFLSVLKLREERLYSRVASLWELVWQFRHWESRDPRDMVFALLGLVSESDAAENNPDYGLTLKQVKNRLL
jgi:hypothetical protein